MVTARIRARHEVLELEAFVGLWMLARGSHGRDRCDGGGRAAGAFLIVLYAVIVAVQLAHA